MYLILADLIGIVGDLLEHWGMKLQECSAKMAAREEERVLDTPRPR